MRNQGLIVIGVVLIAAGLMFLLGSLLNINIAAFCFPAGLILLGFFLIIRPRMVPPGTRSDVLFIGDLERAGQWNVTHEELWSFIGDVNYDLTKAITPLGDTTIRVIGFVNDIEIIVPHDLGVAVSASSFVTSFKLAGQPEEENFLAPVSWQSNNYKLTDRRVRFELTQFVGEIKVREI